ncbi:hypothetical protein [Leptospirillum ferrooxidans]|uniref:hypothetical protein n=1 Tax=Leptospirillum ferrooxidans TaxID=180 RepID=UPI0002EA47D9|nr:hypothetical protein [Leptospirillum ferrooxidans]
MRSKIGFFLALSGLTLFAGCATIGSGCRDVSRADRILFSFKEVIGSTVVFKNSPLVSGAFGSSPKGLPQGFQWPSSSIMVNVGSTSFVMYHVEKCRNEIKYAGRLSYDGQSFPEFHGTLQIDRWSVIFRDPSKNLQMLIKANRLKT